MIHTHSKKCGGQIPSLIRDGGNHHSADRYRDLITAGILEGKGIKALAIVF